MRKARNRTSRKLETQKKKSSSQKILKVVKTIMTTIVIVGDILTDAIDLIVIIRNFFESIMAFL